MEKLTKWIPALAKELYGKQWTPNHSMIVHLKAQAVAKRLGIQWGFEMSTKDINTLRAELKKMKK